LLQGFSALHTNVPAENKNSNQTLTSKFGLDSFCFKQKKWRFFCFAMLLGAALQITNMFGILLSEILVLILVSRDFGWNTLY
jgi:hypothetical protein